VNFHRLAPLLAGTLTSAPPPHTSPPLPDATSNRYQVSAGTLRNGVLSASLVVQMATWHPLADDDPGIKVEAYGEEGRTPSVPGYAADGDGAWVPLTQMTGSRRDPVGAGQLGGLSRRGTR